jgi:purine-cytosine permease-like protein
VILIKGETLKYPVSFTLERFGNLGRISVNMAEINDAEKGLPTTESEKAVDEKQGFVQDIDQSSGDLTVLSEPSAFQKVRAWIRNAGAEEGGLERVPPEARTNQPPRDLFTVFMSVNVGVATLAFGTLGPSLFHLGWWDSFLCILFFNIIGSIPPALMATFGPKLGLRTMVVPRYSFGWYPAKVIAVINLLNQIGWAMVNAIAGAEFLYDVGNGNLPMSVAVLIIGLLAMIIGMFGYKHVHRFERYSWIVVTFCFIIVAGFGAKHMLKAHMGTGAAEVSSVLSFGTTIIGFQISWGPIAADYGVYMRETCKFSFLLVGVSRFVNRAQANLLAYSGGHFSACSSPSSSSSFSAWV